MPPPRVNSSASVRLLLIVHRSGDSGSPRVDDSTRTRKAVRRAASFCSMRWPSAARGPNPLGCQSRLGAGRPVAATHLRPAQMVVRERPVASGHEADAAAAQRLRPRTPPIGGAVAPSSAVAATGISIRTASIVVGVTHTIKGACKTHAEVQSQAFKLFFDNDLTNG